MFKMLVVSVWQRRGDLHLSEKVKGRRHGADFYNNHHLLGNCINPDHLFLTSCLTSGEQLIHGYTKFDFTVDEGKERLNPCRKKN